MDLEDEAEASDMGIRGCIQNADGQPMCNLARSARMRRQIAILGKIDKQPAGLNSQSVIVSIGCPYVAIYLIASLLFEKSMKLVGELLVLALGRYVFSCCLRVVTPIPPTSTSKGLIRGVPQRGAKPLSLSILLLHQPSPRSELINNKIVFKNGWESGRSY